MARLFSIVYVTYNTNLPLRIKSSDHFCHITKCTINYTWFQDLVATNVWCYYAQHVHILIIENVNNWPLCRAHMEDVNNTALDGAIHYDLDFQSLHLDSSVNGICNCNCKEHFCTSEMIYFHSFLIELCGQINCLSFEMEVLHSTLEKTKTKVYTYCYVTWGFFFETPLH